MKIEFTEGEYRDLLTLLFLGNNMVNARFTDEDRPLGYQRYTDLYKRISSLCTETEMNYEFDHDLETGECDPNTEYELELSGMIEDYNNVIFWGNLVDNLATRDAARELKSNGASMTSGTTDKEERYPEYEIANKYTERYTKEFEENGIERITIVGLHPENAENEN